MKDKPRIRKGDTSWQVELPAFGFGPTRIVTGFDTRDDAGRWLVASTRKLSTVGCAIERSNWVYHLNTRYSNYPMKIT